MSEESPSKILAELIRARFDPSSDRVLSQMKWKAKQEEWQEKRASKQRAYKANKQMWEWIRQASDALKRER